MVQETGTFRGKRCPKCSSFIRDGKNKCEVCGFAPEEKKKEVVGIHLVICPHCNTENQADFNFCKICKHPLEDKTVMVKEKESSVLLEETKPAEHTPLSKIILEFHWTEPPHQEVLNMLELIDFHPFFNGYARWDDYAFFVYQYFGLYKVLVRKIYLAGKSIIYRRCKSTVMLKTGSVICLGKIAFQLTEEIPHWNKTVLIGPGSGSTQSNKSKRGVRIINMMAEREFVEISEKCRMGRDWISQQFGLDRESLRMSGVSKEQIRITPLEHGWCQLEPMSSKNIYMAIDEVPVLVEEGETLRWVMGNQYGEFQLKIKKK
jgi:hypothetical protein